VTVELRLTGTGVQTLADNGHMPGWPGDVHPGNTPAGSPDFTLECAAARWYMTATMRRVGKGRVYTGKSTPRDAEAILEYLESVAGALLSESGDPDVRREGRAVRRCVDQAVRHLRHAGVPVVERQRGPFTDYEIDRGPQS